MNTHASAVACETCQLAKSGVGTVTVCPSCGVVHLCLQYLSLRFRTDAFQELVHLLAEAHINLGRLTGDRLYAEDIDTPPAAHGKPH